MSERKPHPSGKPIRKEKYVERSIWRVPDDGYVTPRLQVKQYPSAFGFTARLTSEKSDDE